MHNLFILFGVPFLSSLVVMMVSGLSTKSVKYLAFMLSLLPAFMLVFAHSSWLGSHIQYPWLTPLSIEFHLSVDSLSLIFLYLVAIIIPIAILAESSTNLSYPHFFYGLILLLQGLLIGFFTARDLALFTIFWEAMLLPLYFIIILWGGPQRQAAAIKFLLYMLAGSALMVAAVLSLYFNAIVVTGTGTFNMDTLASISANVPYSFLLCLIFVLAFAVKTPLFPFHAWLPDAYTQASVTGTILLAGILSKAGIYGILRIGMEIFPTAMKEFSPILLGLAIAGVLYGGLAAWMQDDYKKLLAYSSFSHVNFILAGLFAMSQTAETGAILQAFNHGITITGLFLVAGWLQERIGTTYMGYAKGLATYMPYLCWLTMFFVLSSVAVPGFNNFVGEVLILFGLFGERPWWAVVLALTVILSVIYMLRWMQTMYFDEPTPFQMPWIDIKMKEIAIALPLMLLIIWIGIYPASILKQIEPASQKVATLAQLEEH